MVKISNDLFCFIFFVFSPFSISMLAPQIIFWLIQFFNVLFSAGFRNNNFPISQVVQFQDFLLRANKYNCLKMVGDGGASDHKLILVEVCIFTFSIKHCYYIHKCICFLGMLPTIETFIFRRIFQTSFTGNQAAFMIFYGETRRFGVFLYKGSSRSLLLYFATTNTVHFLLETWLFLHFTWKHIHSRFPPKQWPSAEWSANQCISQNYFGLTTSQWYNYYLYCVLCTMFHFCEPPAY